MYFRFCRGLLFDRTLLWAWEKDLKKAKRYLGMACDKKHQEACAAYGKLNSQDIENLLKCHQKYFKKLN